MKSRIVPVTFRLSVVFAAAALATAAFASGNGSITGTVSFARGNKGLLVYVVKAPGNFDPPKKSPVMNQIHMEFHPHVMAVLKGTTVEFVNSDAVNHNVFSPDHEGYNLGVWGKGQHRTYTFKNAGVYTQLCSLHPEMEAFIAVLQNPYYAFTDAKGNFTIKGVPPGHYMVKVWGEKLHSKDRKRAFPVQVKGPKTTLEIHL